MEIAIIDFIPDEIFRSAKPNLKHKQAKVWIGRPLRFCLAGRSIMYRKSTIHTTIRSRVTHNLGFNKYSDKFTKLSAKFTK